MAITKVLNPFFIPQFVPDHWPAPSYMRELTPISPLILLGAARVIA